MAGFKIEGLNEFVKLLEKAATKVPNAKRQFLAKEASWKQTPVTDNSVTIYDNVHYAPFVEKGHRVKIHGKFTGKFVPGRHMLRKAVEESKASFQQDGKAILKSIFSG